MRIFVVVSISIPNLVDNFIYGLGLSPSVFLCQILKLRKDSLFGVLLRLLHSPFRNHRGLKEDRVSMNPISPEQAVYLFYRTLLVDRDSQ